MGDRIEAVKAYRAAHPGCSLLSARNHVDFPGYPQCTHGELLDVKCLRCENARMAAEIVSLRAELAAIRNR